MAESIAGDSIVATITGVGLGYVVTVDTAPIPEPYTVWTTGAGPARAVESSHTLVEALHWIAADVETDLREATLDEINLGASS